MSSGSFSTTARRNGQFLKKLWTLLELGHNDLFWVDATSFRIAAEEHKAVAALNQINPRWYKHKSSFVRQMSYYEFVRVTDGRTMGDRDKDFIIFKDESGHFRRGDRSRLHLIKRKDRPRSAGKRKRSPVVKDLQGEEIDWATSRSRAGPHRGVNRCSSPPAPAVLPARYGQLSPPSFFADPQPSTSANTLNLPPLPQLPPIDHSIPVATDGFIGGWASASSCHSGYGAPSPSPPFFADAYSHGFPAWASTTYPLNKESDTIYQVPRFNDAAYCYGSNGTAGAGYGALSSPESSNMSSYSSSPRSLLFRLSGAPSSTPSSSPLLRCESGTSSGSFDWSLASPLQTQQHGDVYLSSPILSPCTLNYQKGLQHPLLDEGASSAFGANSPYDADYCL